MSYCYRWLDTTIIVQTRRYSTGEYAAPQTTPVAKASLMVHTVPNRTDPRPRGRPSANLKKIRVAEHSSGLGAETPLHGHPWRGQVEQEECKRRVALPIRLWLGASP